MTQNMKRFWGLALPFYLTSGCAIQPSPLLQPVTQPDIKNLGRHIEAPDCMSWDLRKKELKRLLADTEKPGMTMSEKMTRLEKEYRESTSLPLIATEEAWTEEYRKLFEGLNALTTLRNDTRMELRTMIKTEQQAEIITALSNGGIIPPYCRPLPSV